MTTEEKLRQMVEKYQIQLNTVKEVIEKSDDNEDTLTAQAVERFLKGFINELHVLEKLQSENDDSETWSLTDTICHFILPRLQRFKEINASTPAQLTDQEWNGILDKMIIALRLTCKDEGSRIWNDEESKQIDEGLDLFREWFMALWW